MTLEEMKEKAKTKVETDNPTGTAFKINKVYENLMDGTLMTVSFLDSSNKEDFNHVHFNNSDTRVFRWHSDILTAVANYKERNAFFRFLEYAGVGGLLGCVLVLIFSILLFIIAVSKTDVNPSIAEIIKLSFTIILGFFFGSQVSTKK
jgi:hypothetical protein